MLQMITFNKSEESLVSFLVKLVELLVRLVDGVVNGCVHTVRVLPTAWKIHLFETIH